MPVSLNNTTLTFNDATTQTTSGVTSIGTGTGISSTGGKTPTLTNTGVTSVTAGSGISVSASTGGVTISASGGGVSSLNGQTGAITNTNLDAIGSYACALAGVTSPFPNSGNCGMYNVANYAVNSTIAGSSLRYNTFITSNGLSQITTVNAGPSSGASGIGRQSRPYVGGGSSLSGTWRCMAPAYITSGTDTCSSFANWYNGLWVRIS